MKIHAFLYYNMPDWKSKETYISAWPCNVGDDDYRTFISEMDLEVEGLEIPKMEQLIEKRVAAMRDQIEKIKADSFMQIKEIEEKIQQLLCLENKTEVKYVDFI